MQSGSFFKLQFAILWKYAACTTENISRLSIQKSLNQLNFVSLVRVVSSLSCCRYLSTTVSRRREGLAVVDASTLRWGSNYTDAIVHTPIVWPQPAPLTTEGRTDSLWNLFLPQMVNRLRAATIEMRHYDSFIFLHSSACFTITVFAWGGISSRLISVSVTSFGPDDLGRKVGPLQIYHWAGQESKRGVKPRSHWAKMFAFTKSSAWTFGE